MATIDKEFTFTTGNDSETAPDSLALGKNALWVEYGNGASSTGLGGSSTIVEYSLSGKVEQTYHIKGSVDGLKIDPVTGMVWALQNQDGNSTLSLINPKTHTVSGPFSYAAASSTEGYDDVAFLNGAVYLSYTNPNPGDPVLQQLVNGNNPQGALVVKTLLVDGATGTNIATGQTNQPVPLSDPDSLKTTPDGDLILTSGADNSFAIISGVGTAAQSVRFDQLTNLPAGSSLDDVIIPTSSSGTFYVSNAGTDQVEAFKVSGLNTSDAYASVGTEIVQVDLQTGAQTVLVAGLSGSHGLAFAPSTVKAPVVHSQTIFATGSEAGNATGTDSITAGDGSIFVEYGNGADSTGLSGSSTLVQYSQTGKIEYRYSIKGEVDGLKFDPKTGQLWALDNQDGNAKLYLINPVTHKVSDALEYAPPYVYGANSTHGFDDVAFDGSKVFLSETNPANIGDPVVVQLNNGNNPSGPLTTTPILRFGDTGTNLLTGQVNQPIPITDPDSLKTLPDGSLILTGGADGSLIFISHPGTPQQSVSFVNLPAGTASPDDAIMPTSRAGTFYISNGGANDVVKATVTGLDTHDIYVALPGNNSVDQLDLKTGALTPVITGLNSPHGLLFVPASRGSGGVAASLKDIAASAGAGLQKDLLGSTTGGAQASAEFATDVASQESAAAGYIGSLLATDSHATQALVKPPFLHGFG